MTSLSRQFPLTDLNRGPAALSIAASAAECAAVATRLGLSAIHAIQAKLMIRRSQGRIFVQGTIVAEIEQVCVVSLEPFHTSAGADIDEVFLITDDPGSPEIDLDPNDTMAEPLTGETLDLGELIVQNLSLAIDPHPRAEGATLTDLDYDDGQFGAPDNPFAALAKLRPKR